MTNKNWANASDLEQTLAIGGQYKRKSIEGESEFEYSLFKMQVLSIGSPTQAQERAKKMPYIASENTANLQV
jgi:hypothetical protein